VDAATKLRIDGRGIGLFAGRLYKWRRANPDGGLQQYLGIINLENQWGPEATKALARYFWPRSPATSLTSAPNVKGSGQRRAKVPSVGSIGAAERLAVQVLLEAGLIQRKGGRLVVRVSAIRRIAET
jgi:hypothetical protein